MKIRVIYLVPALAAAGAAHCLAGESAVKSVRLVPPKQAGQVVENIGQVLARQIQQRCDAKVVKDGEAPLTVELAVAPGIGSEGYRIEDRQGGGVRIVGNDERGVLYGAGKFLRSSRYDKGGFTPGGWRGTSAPQKPVRGIYFATRPIGTVFDIAATSSENPAVYRVSREKAGCSADRRQVS